MDTIRLEHTLPEVFTGRDRVKSDIWLREVVFEKGKKYLIEAASGTGKSSLCGYIYGYRNDYRGDIRFDRQEIRTLSAARWRAIRKKHLSLLFQDLRLFPELNAYENIQLKNNLTGYRSNKAIKELFEKFGIGDKLFQPVGKLSFGQQQRVALIRSLCQPCDFLFLDEPVSHLDDANGEIIREVITGEAAATGAAIIVTSIGKHPGFQYDKTFEL